MPQLCAKWDTCKFLRLAVTQYPALESYGSLVAADRYKLMTAAFQVRRQLSKLAWKVLMNQQQSHLAP